MVTIKTINKVTPREFAPSKFDYNVTYKRKTYFLGIRIWNVDTEKTVSTDYAPAIKKKKLGFIEVEEEAIGETNKPNHGKD